jgi:hypothetical protein
LEVSKRFTSNIPSVLILMGGDGYRKPRQIAGISGAFAEAGVKPNPSHVYTRDRIPNISLTELKVNRVTVQRVAFEILPCAKKWGVDFMAQPPEGSKPHFSGLYKVGSLPPPPASLEHSGL